MRDNSGVQQYNILWRLPGTSLQHSSSHMHTNKALTKWWDNNWLLHVDTAIYACTKCKAWKVLNLYHLMANFSRKDAKIPTHLMEWLFFFICTYSYYTCIRKLKWCSLYTHHNCPLFVCQIACSVLKENELGAHTHAYFRAKTPTFLWPVSWRAVS